MAKMQQPLPGDKLSMILQEIDLVALHPDGAQDYEPMLTAARESISGVLRDFLKSMGLDAARISVLDGFLFLFNEPKFTRWHTLNWWEQRQYILEIKDYPPYIARAQFLLSRSRRASFMDHSDDMVAKSADPEVKRAWMCKRLVLHECYWNVLDSIAHAAYLQKKYEEMFPAFCVLLCNVIVGDGSAKEMVLGIDNGIGFLYKKRSRESALFRFFYHVYKHIYSKGVFCIGGLELGLLETESELSCHGAGAVVYQGW